MTTQIKTILITGIQNKLNRGEQLENILASYTKLSDDDKQELRDFFKRLNIVNK